MQRDAYEQQAAREKEEDDEPQLHIWVAVFTLAAATVIIALCAEFMVDSIDAITKVSLLNSLGLSYCRLSAMPLNMQLLSL